MAILRNTAEGGSNGTAVTTANSGGVSGDPWTAVSVAGSSAITFSTGQSQKGSLAYLFTTNATDTQYVSWVNAATGNSAVFRGYFYLPSLPSSSNALIKIMSASGATTDANILVDNLGHLLIQGVAQTTLFTSTGTIPTGAWFRVELDITNGNSTTGVLNLDAYTGDSTTAISGLSIAQTASDFGTGLIGQVRVGRAFAAGAMASFYADDLAFNVASTTRFGPSASNVPPTADAGSAITNGVVGTPVSRTASDSDPDGTVVTRAWTLIGYPWGSVAPTLSGASTATVGFTPSATGMYILGYQVTDNIGATSSLSTLKVYVPGTTVRPLSITSNPGGWTNVGGAADLVTALLDGVPGTYAQSNTTAVTPSIIRLRLDPLQTPTAFHIDPTWLLSASSAGTAKVRLIQGSTTRKEWVATAGNVPTTTAATRQFVLDPTADAAVYTAITSWLDLDIELEWG